MPLFPVRGELGVAGVAAALATLAASSPSHAQFVTRLELRGELGYTVALPSYQRETLGETSGGYAAVRAGVRIVGPLALQASYDTYLLPAHAGRLAQQHDVTGGVRFEPRFGFGRIFVDANAGAGFTGGRARFAFDVGAGVEFEPLAWLRLGPVVRYGHLVAADQDYPSDAQYITFGVSVALGLQEPREPARAARALSAADTDGDRVADDRDVCPRVPAGAFADPQRPGCPLLDGDHDGVPDRDDVCPAVARGPHPSVVRAGCPVEDADGDGIADADDACATIAQGAHPDPARRGCPEGDRDGDGVLDSADACPATGPGLHPDPARPGCGLPDADNDSVPDARDACPQVAGAPHTDPRRNGCPGLLRVESTQVRILRPIFFESGSNRIRPRSRGVLQAITQMLLATPEIRRLSIEGHTDEAGDAARNLALSRERASAVMGWLVRYGGVEAQRLTPEGYGESRPLVPGSTPEARAANRRVEFHIVDPPASEASRTSATPEVPR